jgi:outer membrane protein TolC
MNRLFVLVLLILILILVPSVAFAKSFEIIELPTAKPVMNLSLDQAVEIAVERNLGIKAELAKAKIASAEVVTAKALPNPILLSDNGVAEDSYRLGIQQVVPLGGKIRNRVKAAEERRQVVTAEFRSELLQLRRAVRLAYAQLYLQREKRRILELLVQHYDEFQHENPSFENQVQIEFVETTTRNDLANILYEEKIALHNLNSLLYQPFDTDLILEKPRTTIRGNTPLNQLLEASLLKSPDLIRNQAQIKVTHHELQLAKANRIPNFIFAVGPDLVTPPEKSQFSVFAIGYVDLPILNRQQGPIQEAHARQLQLNAARQAIQNHVALAITNAYTTYQHTLDRLNIHERHLVPEAQNLQAQSKKVHTIGKLTVDTLVEADTHRANIELSYLKILIQNQEAISDLESATGEEL